VGGVPASFALGEGDNLVGSRLESEVVLAERGVSRRHALVRVRAGGIEVEDLGSKNGTWRGETRLGARTTLADGDELRIGAVRVTYRGPAVEGRGETETYA
jgi:pSer/pThr/pTyr-binding forkhead associated (FHA) protein